MGNGATKAGNGPGNPSAGNPILNTNELVDENNSNPRQSIINQQGNGSQQPSQGQSPAQSQASPQNQQSSANQQQQSGQNSAANPQAEGKGAKKAGKNTKKGKDTKNESGMSFFQGFGEYTGESENSQIMEPHEQIKSRELELKEISEVDRKRLEEEERKRKEEEERRLREEEEQRRREEEERRRKEEEDRRRREYEEDVRRAQEELKREEENLPSIYSEDVDDGYEPSDLKEFADESVVGRAAIENDSKSPDNFLPTIPYIQSEQGSINDPTRLTARNAGEFSKQVSLSLIVNFSNICLFDRMEQSLKEAAETRWPLSTKGRPLSSKVRPKRVAGINFHVFDLFLPFESNSIVKRPR